MFSASLSILPITVLSIAKWTRFLTPGTGNICPDLAASIRFRSASTPSHPSPLLPTLHLYVLHTTIFRIDIPLSASVISNLQATNNPSVITDAVAVRFELGRGQVRFACWIDEEGAGWKEVGDFTGGEAGAGGRVELTGPASVSITSAAFEINKSLLRPTTTDITTSLFYSPTTPHEYRLSNSYFQFPHLRAHLYPPKAYQCLASPHQCQHSVSLQSNLNPTFLFLTSQPYRHAAPSTFKCQRRYRHDVPLPSRATSCYTSSSRTSETAVLLTTDLSDICIDQRYDAH